MVSNKTHKLKLYPSYAPPVTWRDSEERKELSRVDWKKVRAKILKRDDYQCQYCGYRNPKGQIIDHINDNPKDNREKNLQTICRMCNLIKHSGIGCVISGIVSLYRKSKFGQVEIIQITRKMREGGKMDSEILDYLGLEEQVSFKMDENYLKTTYGFVSSRRWRKKVGKVPWQIRKERKKKL